MSLATRLYYFMHAVRDSKSPFLSTLESDAVFASEVKLHQHLYGQFALFY